MGFRPDRSESGHHGIRLSLSSALLLLRYFLLPYQTFDEKPRQTRQDELLIDGLLTFRRRCEPLGHRLAGAAVRHPEPLAEGLRVIWEYLRAQVHRDVQSCIPVLHACEPKTREEGGKTRMENDNLTDYAAHFKSASHHDCGQ